MWGEQESKSASPAWDIWRCHCSHSPQGDGLYQDWVGSWEVKCQNCKPPLTGKYVSNWRYIKCNSFNFVGSGLGRLLAIRFAKLGATLILCDVNTEGNEETAKMVQEEGAKVYTYTCDLSQRNKIYYTTDKVRNCFCLTTFSYGVFRHRAIQWRIYMYFLYKYFKRDPPPTNRTQFFRFYIHFHQKVPVLEVWLGLYTDNGQSMIV